MVGNVCPQISAQSIRKWCFNWFRNHLARFQHINYFHCFSKVVKHNCYSFGLINRMHNAGNCSHAPLRSYFKVLWPWSFSSFADLYFFSLSFFCLSAFPSLLWLRWVAVLQSHMPVVHRTANQTWQCDCRQNRECEETVLLYTHTDSLRPNWTALPVAR